MKIEIKSVAADTFLGVIRYSICVSDDVNSLDTEYYSPVSQEAKPTFDELEQSVRDARTKAIAEWNALFIDKPIEEPEAVEIVKAAPIAEVIEEAKAPEAEEVKPKRKRRTKAQIEADKLPEKELKPGEAEVIIHDPRVEGIVVETTPAPEVKEEPKAKAATKAPKAKEPEIVHYTRGKPKSQKALIPLLTKQFGKDWTESTRAVQVAVEISNRLQADETPILIDGKASPEFQPLVEKYLVELLEDDK